MGFFVPVSDAYLKRKMRHSHPPVVLSPEIRVRMLQAMCANDSRLQVCEKEIGTIEPRTMPTLLALQEDYPEAELYFVMGADKFDLLASLTKKRQFLDAFKVVLFSSDKAEQRRLIKTVQKCKANQMSNASKLLKAMLDFSNIVDGRIGEEFEEDLNDEQTNEP